VISIGQGMFSGCTNLKSVTISNGITSISQDTFKGCRSLTSITIPNSVTQIGTDAFLNCNSLTSINCLSVVPPTMSNNVFGGVPIASVCLYVPQPVIAAYNSADIWKNFSCTQAYSGAYQVTFDVKGGSEVSTQYALSGYKVVKPTKPTRGGANFGDWYMDAAYTTPWDFSTDLVTSNITLYAKWMIAVSFVAGGNGTVSATVDGNTITPGTEVDYGKSIVFTATPDAGYKLAYWYDYSAQPIDSVNYTYTVSPPYPTYAGSATVGIGALFTKNSISVLESDRVIPQAKPTEEAVVIVPITVLSGEFTAGPNPVGKQSSGIAFFRQGKRIANAELRIYDATGNVINKVNITDNAIGNQARCQVGSWDLTDNKGRPVSEGTYLVKGVVKTSDGKSEKVSVIVGVR